MTETSHAAAPAPRDTRQPWLTPAIETMRAGDAELGATPVIPEGPFGTGS